MTLAVIIPAYNEEGTIGPLVHETFRVIPPEILSEVIVVDDGSSDGTGNEIKALIPVYSRLRYIRHRARTGQSAAVQTGVLATRRPLIGTLDGDGQNDPADIPSLLQRIGAPGRGGPAFVGGVRRERKAKSSRRIASLFGNAARRAVLGDECPDSACGIKVFRREAFLRLPFFTSMHRFNPALFLMYGHTVDYVAVNDRPRLAGELKYTNISRLLLGVQDIIGILWLRRRTRIPEISEDTLGVSRLTQSAAAYRRLMPAASRRIH